jgi:hypothetical protein
VARSRALSAESPTDSIRGGSHRQGDPGSRRPLGGRFPGPLPTAVTGASARNRPQRLPSAKGHERLILIRLPNVAQAPHGGGLLLDKRQVGQGPQTLVSLPERP